LEALRDELEYADSDKHKQIQGSCKELREILKIETQAETILEQ